MRVVREPRYHLLLALSSFSFLSTWIFGIMSVVWNTVCWPCPERIHWIKDGYIDPGSWVHFLSCSCSPWSVSQISRSVVSDSLQPHELQHARPPCPSPTPGVHPNSCLSSQWCHPAISSSVVPFSSCPQSLPASESFPLSQLFAWGGQSIGVSALASFLPKNTQDRSPLEWTGWISLHSKGLSRVFSNTTVQKPQFFSAQHSSQSNSHIHTWPQEKPLPCSVPRDKSTLNCVSYPSRIFAARGNPDRHTIRYPSLFGSQDKRLVLIARYILEHSYGRIQLFPFTDTVQRSRYLKKDQSHFSKTYP